MVRPALSPAALSDAISALSQNGWTTSPSYIWNKTVSPTFHLPEGDAINEGMLKEFRVANFTRKVFNRGQRSIYVDAYQFDSVDGALAAYYFLRRGATTVLKRGDGASEDADSISFVQGKTFISIYGTSADDEESKEVVSSLANRVGAFIAPGGQRPAVLAKLGRLDLLAGSERLVMGPLSARRFCPAPYVQTLVGEECLTGCVADYQIQEPAKERLKLLLVEYGEQKQAAGRYNDYINALCESRKEDPATRQGETINLFKIGPSYVAVELRGNTIALVSGARKRYSPQMVLRQLRF